MHDFKKYTSPEECFSRFRILSREIWNEYFRISEPYEDENRNFDLIERFQVIEDVLFQQLVVAPLQLPSTEYGHTLPGIRVAPLYLPVDISVEEVTDSGGKRAYSLKVDKNIELSFISFFDWGQLGVRDNQYVRVQIHDYPGYPEVAGKRALLESYQVKFELCS